MKSSLLNHYKTYFQYITEKRFFHPVSYFYRNRKYIVRKRQGYTLRTGWYHPFLYKVSPFWGYGVALSEKECIFWVNR